MTNRPRRKNHFTLAPRTYRRDRIRVRPGLECMEDRCLLATLFVNRSTDLGDYGTLREVIQRAKSGDTIEFAPHINSVTLNPAFGSLVVAKNLTIKGTPGNKVLISGAFSTREFTVDPGTNVTMDYL
jgi:hypothetical protein